MAVLTVSEAQQHLPELLEAARQGQPVEIIQADQRFRLLAYPRYPRGHGLRSPAYPKPGVMKAD